MGAIIGERKAVVREIVGREISKSKSEAYGATSIIDARYLSLRRISAIKLKLRISLASVANACRSELIRCSNQYAL